MNDERKQELERLSALKTGDEVFVVWSRGSKAELATVTRTTKTQILVGTTRYKKSDGYEIGGDRWSHRQLKTATVERREQFQNGLVLDGFSDTVSVMKSDIKTEVTKIIRRLSPNHYVSSKAFVETSKVDEAREELKRLRGLLTRIEQIDADLSTD